MGMKTCVRFWSFKKPECEASQVWWLCLFPLSKQMRLLVCVSSPPLHTWTFLFKSNSNDAFQEGPTQPATKREQRESKKSVSLSKPSAVSAPRCLSDGVNKLFQSISYDGLTVIYEHDKYLPALTCFIYMLIILQHCSLYKKCIVSRDLISCKLCLLLYKIPSEFLCRNVDSNIGAALPSPTTNTCWKLIFIG